MLYFGLNIDYIVEKYCVNKDKPVLQCNGKCHLSKQLQLQQTSKKGDNALTIQLTEAFFPLYFIETSIDIPSDNFELLQKNNWSPSFFKEAFINRVPSPPPKLS